MHHISVKCEVKEHPSSLIDGTCDMFNRAIRHCLKPTLLKDGITKKELCASLCRAADALVAIIESVLARTGTGCTRQ